MNWISEDKANDEYKKNSHFIHHHYRAPMSQCDNWKLQASLCGSREGAQLP